MRTEPFICRPVERFSVVGMGDAGQEFGTFLQTAAIEIYTAKFGYNPVCVGSRGNDSGARVQLRYNHRDTDGDYHGGTTQAGEIAWISVPRIKEET